MGQQRLAVIGLGNMGSGVACRLLESGYDVAVYNRTREKTGEAEGRGARVAESPADAARHAEVVVLSLADHHVVEAMLFDADGVFETLGAGGYVVDMSTVPPKFARQLARRSVERQCHPLDACILGNKRHAMTGELRVMVGGTEADFRAVEGILGVVGKEVTHVGDSGLGATMKLVLNMLMGIEMQGLAEAVAFGERAGLDRHKVLQLIARSGYSSPVMSFKCGAMERRSFQQADFKLRLMRKDMMLTLAECQELGVPMPASESAYTMLTGALQQGLGDLDCSAILAFMERLSGLEQYAWPGTGEAP